MMLGDLMYRKNQYEDAAENFLQLLEKRPKNYSAMVQYVLLLKTLVHIEGLGRSIYPQLDIWSLGRPLMEAWMMEQFGPVATMKKLQERAPEWLASLPDMPDLLRDSLEQLRDAPARERQHEARMEALLTRNRRRTLMGLAGLGLLAWPVAAGLNPGTAVAAAAGAILLWRGWRQ